MTPVRILVADDHEIFRHGVRTLLERQTGWIVCGEASTGRDAVAKAIALQPDVVVLDISMPELNGLEVVRQIRRAVASKVLILSVHEFDQIVTAVVEAGAHGYVLKSDAGNKLVRAVHALLHDQQFFTERLRTLATPVARRAGTGTPHRRVSRLTPRQIEVLQLLAEGKSNKEIGATLGVTTKTAETHRAQIMARLDLHSKTELVRYAIRNRIIEA
jgi:DNA-binding NarL/FixJ family response regulator